MLPAANSRPSNSIQSLTRGRLRKFPFQGKDPSPALSARTIPHRLLRIESGKYHPAFRAQYPFDLAQDLVGIVAELQHVRQDDQVDGLRFEGQEHGVGMDLGFASSPHLMRWGIRLLRRKSTSGSPTWTALNPNTSATARSK